MFSLFKRKSELYPWYGKQPILEFIKAHIDEKGDLTPEGEELPDSNEFYSGKSFRWAAGAMDGVLSHHTVGSDQQMNKVNQLIEKLRKQTAKQDIKRDEQHTWKLWMRVF